MTRSDCILSNLSPERQEGIETMASHMNLAAISMALAERQNIRVSPSTLSRFLRRRAEERLQAQRAELTQAAEAAIQTVNRQKIRQGALALLQERIFEDAVASRDAKQIQAAYRMLSAEEARESQIALAARHAVVAEERAKTLRRQAELAAAKTALALLPKLTEILTRDGVPDADILEDARACLLAGGGRQIAESASE